MEAMLTNKPLKTYVNTRKIVQKPKSIDPDVTLLKGVPLTTKKAVELLLEGTLRSKVCRYCLNISFPLSELDQILRIGGRGALYEVTIRDMVAAVHPFKVINDPNYPNKICSKCLDQAIRSYLFAQQCEQSERALRNCFEDMFNKLEKLDPLERVKKRGRQKLNPNNNVLYAEHDKVMDYAEPIRHLINLGAIPLTKEPAMTDLECKKCWQVLPNVESLVNHEKMHPKTMWFHCRTCGRSFVKRHNLKKHLTVHNKSTAIALPEEVKFECKQCTHVTENHLLHLQHIEKHKFQSVLEHLVDKNMDKLCTVCLDKGKLVDLDKTICLHGGYPELTGDRTLYNILGFTIPEMNILQNYTGTKICENCLDKAITSYVFINRTHYIRSRLDTCITHMLENLNQISKPEGKLFVEIAQNSILPFVEQDDIEDLLIDENAVDEDKLKIDVLEDEFRLKSESEDSESDTEAANTKLNNMNLENYTHSPKVDTKLMNGYQSYDTKIEDVCSEFLTFKKKRKRCRKVYKCKFTCPLCNKNFISEYFLKRHVLKHVNKKVECKLCERQFRTKFYWYEHMKITHVLNKSCYWSCKTCGRIFTSENKLLKHQQNHMTQQCQLCSKVFVSQRFYDSHMQRHVIKLNILKESNAQNCSICEKECLNDNDLVVHVNKVHLQIKPYSCDMCEHQFYTESDMRSHKKVHSLIRKEKCEFCSRMLRCRKDLVVHVRKHIGVKPFKCIICLQAFYSELKVRNHMNKWHGGCHCCRLCKKVFVNKNGLNNHVYRAHSVF